MTTEIETGGPAFPTEDKNRKEDYGTYGMTLRDYFAGMAMHTELMTCGVPSESHDALISACSEAGLDPIERMADNAYAIADAMLKARAA